MIRATAVLCLLLASSVPLAAQQPTPEAVRIEASDVSRFLAALDTLRAAGTYRDSARVLFERYYHPGSEGLLDFVRLRVGSVYHLLDHIRARPAYYAHLQQSLAGLPASTPRVRQAFRHFEEIYPDAVFTDIYWIVGRMNSGGTISPDKILLGAEMYGRDASAPTQELNDWERSVLRDTSMVVAIATHELMHINQPPERGRLSLLQRALREGGADFLAELVTGRNINDHVHRWANPREAELWREFREAAAGTDYTGWMGGGSAGRPADLAYWMGYKIAQSYYEQAVDKRRAIADILAASGGDHAAAEEFLARSGYPVASRRQ